jgi:hypothetical protein
VSEELLKALIAEQRTTNDLLRALVQRSAVSEVYRLPRIASDEAQLALGLAEAWVVEVKASFALGLVPSDVSGELILALASLPNTLSQPVPIRDAAGSTFWKC